MNPDHLQHAPGRPSRVAPWLTVLTMLLAVAPFVALTALPASAAPGISAAVTMPAGQLYGTPVAVTVTGSNPTGDVPVYNAATRVVLPVGVTYVAGSSSAGEPTVVPNQPSAGLTTLLFVNTADIQAGSDASVSFSVQPAVEGVGGTSVGNAIKPGSAFTLAATVYVNSDPRTIPRFTTTGAPVSGSYTDSAAQSGTTAIEAYTLTKAEPSPEHELVRGVQTHQTTYTLTLANNQVKATNGISVVDYLPAGLEFLSCGITSGTGSTTSAATNPGSLDEYAGAPAFSTTALTPGTADGQCPTPTAVDTVDVDPDGSGPLPAAVYTKVTYSNVHSLAVGEVYRFTYKAGIPIRANTLAFTGSTPSTASLAQAANLDNNSGAVTTDEQALTNLALGTGTYTGTLGSGSNPVTASGLLRITAENLALQKSIDNGEFRQGETRTYTLTYESSQYRASTGIRVTDTLPNGQCPLGAVNYDVQADAECAPTGAAPSVPYTSVTENADGTFTLVWDLPDQSASGVSSLTFPVADRTQRQQNGADLAPTFSGDSYTNTVHVDATSVPEPGTLTGTADPAGDLPAPDDSAAGQSTTGAQITKSVSARPAGALSCATATYTRTPPLMRRGDTICYRLRVDYSTGTSTRNSVVTDFLPPGVTYTTGSAATTGSNSVTLQTTAGSPQPDVSPDGTQLTWRVGAAAGGDLVVQRGGTFEVDIAGTVNGDPATLSQADIISNLMKFTSVSSSDVATSLRDAQDFSLVAPALTLAKSASPTSAVAGQTVAYTVTVTNAGGAAAVNASVRDILPASITCSDVSAISNSGTCATQAVAGGGTHDALTWTGLADLAPTASTALSYSLTLPDPVGAGQVFVNTAGVRSYSADTTTAGTPGPTYVPANNVDPSLTPTPGTPAARATATVTVPGVSLTKSVTSPVDGAGNGTGQATIGETLSYTVVESIPAGTSVDNAVLNDPLGSRETYVTGSLTTTIDTGSGPTALPGTFAVTDTGNVIRVVFPTPYDNTGGSPIVVTATFQATVNDVIANVRNGSLPNTATASYDRPDGSVASPVTATASTTVVEPRLAITKTDDLSGTAVTPGQDITYTVTASDLSGTSVSTAHDAVVTDVVPAGMTITAVGQSGVVSGQTITWPAADIAPGASRVYTYTATVDDGAVAGQAMTNTASVTGASLPGSATGSRTTGSGYTASATDTITVVGATLAKSIADPVAAPGETSTFTVTASVPAQVTLYDAALLDTLPTGYSSPAVTSITCTNATAEVCAGFSPTSLTASGATFGEGLGTLTSDSARTVTMIYTAVLDPALAGARGTSLTNTAVLYWRPTAGVAPAAVIDVSTTGPASNPATATARVAEPRLTETKSVSPTTAHPGDTVTYTITVSNDSGTSGSPSATAYAVVVDDAVPAGLQSAGSVEVDGSSSGSVVSGVVTATIPSIAPGSSHTVTFSAVVTPFAATGPGTIHNSAQVAGYASQPGTGGRSYGSTATPATPDAPLTVVDARIGDLVFADSNANGVRDSGEPGVDGIAVTLYAASDTAFSAALAATTTGSSGSYLFPDLPAGDYVVAFGTTPTGTAYTTANVGAEASDSDADPTSGRTGTRTVVDGQHDTDVDAGIVALVPLSGVVFGDDDDNGTQGAGERGLPSVSVTLSGTDDRGDPVSATTTTDSAGAYTFPGLRPGTYAVSQDQATVPSPYLDGSTTAGSTGGTAGTNTVTGIPVAGVASSGNDFAEIPAASLAGLVWADLDGNGVVDSADLRLPGVTVTLTGTDDRGAPVSRSTTTASDGTYSFGSLRPGTYAVAEDQAGVPGAYVDGQTFLGTAGGTVGDDVVVAISLVAGTTTTGYDFSELLPGVISGVVYADDDNDGVVDAGEGPLPGVTVTLDGIDVHGNAVHLTTTTGSDGAYAFTHLGPGSYAVTEDQTTVPSPYLDGTTTVGSGGGTGVDNVVSGIVLVPGPTSSAGNDFGELAPASVSGVVYVDADNDGQSDGDTGIAGVTVTLTGTDDSGDAVTRDATTGPDGTYSFAGLRPGTYTVTEAQPSGYLEGKTTAGTVGSSTAGTAGDDMITAITLAPGDAAVQERFGELVPASIGGTVFADSDDDGVQQSGEAGLIGVSVTLVGTDDLGSPVAASTTTAADGTYAFTGLRPGTYAVVEDQATVPTPYVDGRDALGTAGGSIAKSAPLTADDAMTAITLASGTVGAGYDFGEIVLGGLAGTVYHDADQDGARSGGEPGLGGGTVTITGTDDFGRPVLVTAPVATDGTYASPPLRPGTYTVTIPTPTGYAPTEVPGPAAVSPGDVTQPIDLGFVLATSALGDRVFRDTNGNGIQNSGEPGVAGVTVTLFGGSGALLSTTVTDATGHYRFTSLTPGTYTIGFSDLPSGTTFTIAGAGDLLGLDSDASPSTGRTSVITLAEAEVDLDLDAGIVDGGVITGTVGAPGILVTIKGTTITGLAVVVTTTSGAGGAFTSPILPPGTYTVSAGGRTSLPMTLAPGQALVVDLAASGLPVTGAPLLSLLELGVGLALLGVLLVSLGRLRRRRS